MTVRRDIAGVVNNDLLVTFRLTLNDLTLNLAGYTVTAIVKPTASSADSAGVTYSVGSGITILASYAGVFQLAIPRASLTVTGASWYRVDVSNGAVLASAICGVLNLSAA